MWKLVFFVSLLLTSSHKLEARASKDHTRWLQKELNLTRSQKTKIKDILDKYRPQIEELEGKYLESKNELRKTFRSAEKTIKRKEGLLTRFEDSRKWNDLHQRTRFIMALEIRDVLNEEQLQKLNSLKNFKPAR